MVSKGAVTVSHLKRSLQAAVDGMEAQEARLHPCGDILVTVFLLLADGNKAQFHRRHAFFSDFRVHCLLPDASEWIVRLLRTVIQDHLFARCRKSARLRCSGPE